MPTYKGFNTIKQNKKFGTTDKDLVIRDLLNAFLIRSGEIAGRPDLGTTIWSYIFEPNVIEVRNALEAEVTRIIKSDPRLILQSINISYSRNTVIIEVEVVISPNTAPEKLYLNFVKDTEELYIT